MMHFLMKSLLSDLARRLKSFMHINDEQYVLASTEQIDFHWATRVDVQELKRIVVTLVWVARCTIFFLDTHDTCST